MFIAGAPKKQTHLTNDSDSLSFYYVRYCYIDRTEITITFDAGNGCYWYEENHASW